MLTQRLNVILYLQKKTSQGSTAILLLKNRHSIVMSIFGGTTFVSRHHIALRYFL